MPPRPTRITDWRESLTLRAALRTGLLERFREPSRVDAAADAAGLDRRATGVVAGALRDQGHLEDAPGGALVLSARGREVAASPAAIGEIHLEARAMAGHLRLDEVLRTGRPIDDVSAGDPGTRRAFMEAMRPPALRRAPETLAALGPPAGAGRLLDVGGAPGTYARAFSEAGWSVTVLDLPGTLALGEDELRAAGVATVPGDARVGLPAGPWDAVFLGNIVQLFAPDDAAALIARAGGALAPGGLLAIQGVVGDRCPHGPLFAMMMLVATEGGDAHAERSYRDWMEAAGCPAERSLPIDGGWHHLFLGRRAA